MKLEELHKLLLEAEANHKIISERKEKGNKSSEKIQNEVKLIPIDLFSEAEITETTEAVQMDEVDDETDTSRW